MSADELYDEVSGENSDSGSEEDVDSFDEIVIMRFSQEQTPQLVEITNPEHKIIVGEVKRAKFNFRSLQRLN